MTSTTDTDSGGSGTAAEEPWTLTAMMRRHPRVTAASVAVLIVLIAITVLTTFSSPRRQPLSDAATCSQWAGATPAQQAAYSHVYIDEYGTLANTAANAAAVQRAIDRDCTHASYLGEAGDITVLAALRHAF